MGLKKVFVFVFAVLALMVAGGCAGKLVSGHIEKGIAERLPELIGPARSYKVEVDGSAGKLIKGKIPRLEIVGIGVQPGGQYYLDELRITMTGVQANTKTQTVESIESTVFTAALTERSLNKYLRDSQPKLKELKVDLRKGDVMVHTRPEISRFSASVDLVGDLKIESGTRLRYVVDRMKIAGINTPGFVADFVEDRINPVLDISKFGFPARLESVRVEPEFVQIGGTADLSKGLPAAGR